VSKSPGRRLRAALVPLAAVAIAASAASPAFADGGTPLTPTKLINGSDACATDASAPAYENANNGLRIEGAPSDSDPAVLTVGETYQLWPVSNPAQLSTWTFGTVPNGLEEPMNVPASDLPDGQTYAWQAQTVAPDGTTSAWSAPCYITIEDGAPANAPTITSANYPAGVADQPGAPIQVTLGANGVDTTGYVFSWTGNPPVPEFNGQLSDPYMGVAGSEPVSTVGGSVTLDLVPPNGNGLQILSVESVNRAGTPSPLARYEIDLKPSAPSMTLLGSRPNIGSPTTFVLTPDPGIEAQSPVTSYKVTVAGGASGQQNYSVPAAADGTATVPVTFTSGAGFVQISSVSADGWVSDVNEYFLDTAPHISSDVYAENATGGGVGVTGTFTFTPSVNDVASYTYSWGGGFGAPQTVVKAHGGKATINWTPTASGSYDLEVFATAKDGTQLAPSDYSFTVN
jgi:hypothetical protein